METKTKTETETKNESVKKRIRKIIIYCETSEIKPLAIIKEFLRPKGDV